MAKPTARVETRSKRGSRDLRGDVSQPLSAQPKVSDVTIARAIAAAVRATPAVVGLSPGHLALAATHGPNERVVGVVVRHPGPRDTAVEVHVIIATEALRQVKTQRGTTDVAALARVGNQVRDAVYRAVHELSLAPPSAVDVLMDDIR